MTTLLSPDERNASASGRHQPAYSPDPRAGKILSQCRVPIEIKVVWHNRPFEAIIQEVISGARFGAKMAHQHDRLEAVIFTPTDWHLLRKMPKPGVDGERPAVAGRRQGAGGGESRQ